jgi:hypothetical protein
MKPAGVIGYGWTAQRLPSECRGVLRKGPVRHDPSQQLGPSVSPGLARLHHGDTEQGGNNVHEFMFQCIIDTAAGKVNFRLRFGDLGFSRADRRVRVSRRITYVVMCSVRGSANASSTCCNRNSCSLLRNGCRRTSSQQNQ